MTEKLECIKDLINSCLLPALKNDLDNVQIDLETFKDYHESLRQQLPVLYDILQQGGKELLMASEGLEVYGLLIVLLCEITADNAIFKLNAANNLTRNAERILQELKVMPNEVEANIFSYYQSKLSKEEWKHQIGSVHGFLRYLEFKYNPNDETENLLTTHWLHFCLSIGLNVQKCVDPSIKHIGIRIFLIILDHSQLSEILIVNIHNVIYDAIQNDVYMQDNIMITCDIWNCILKCLEYDKEIDGFEWNKCDDMLERLINNVMLSSNSKTSMCLIQFITRLGYCFTLKKEEIASKLASDFRQDSDKMLEDCRFVCEGNTSYTCFRWAKAILHMFVLESHWLLENKEICQQMLLELHRCYLICILPIPLPVSYPHLIEFYDKFTAVLLGAINIYEKEPNIVKLVHQFIETLYQQMQHCLPFCNENTKLRMYRNAYEELLKRDLWTSSI